MAESVAGASWTVFHPGAAAVAGWDALATRYTLWELCVYGSPLVHLLALFVLNAVPFMLQFISGTERFKIQKIQTPPLLTQAKVLLAVLASQAFIQAPLIIFFYYFIAFWEIPYDAASLPGLGSMVVRLYLSMVLEDAWHYVMHRALHHKSLYRHIHKVHHTYTSPFGVAAEFAHPIETVVLGGGFMLGCTLFCTHLAFGWAWLVLRLVETSDVHSGYDFPWNPLHLLPGYAGARFHDFHHKNFTGNYASSFVWWDSLFGTDKEFKAFKLKQRWSTVDKRPASDVGAGDRRRKAGKQSEDLKCPSVCLVTGAGGMVGSALVSTLLQRGATRVIALDIREVPAAERVTPTQGQQGTVHYHMADITKPESLSGHFDGVDCVFHIAALVGPFFPQKAYLAVNYTGTLNVLEAAKKAGVPAFVDCSSPSTRFTGAHVRGATEASLPYATDAQSTHEYARTKALGEQAVLAANCAELATCAVMPHQVYGESDQLFLPALLRTAGEGRLRVFGEAGIVVSFCHCDNLCHALVLAGNKLAGLNGAEAKKKVAGEAFFVTDGGARAFWEEIDMAAQRVGLPSFINKTPLPTSLLYALGYLGQLYTNLTGQFVRLTPFTVNMLTIDRHFNIDKARKLLGYAPVREFDEAWPKVVDAICARDFAYIKAGNKAKTL